MIRVCLAGATGWAGAALARGIARTNDIAVVAGVSRSHAGQTLGRVLGEPRLECPVFGSAHEALEIPCDVFMEYTKADAAMANIKAALGSSLHVVVGTSGLTESDYAEIDVIATEKRLGVLAAGNFALPVVLLQRFAELASTYLPSWEIFDYASATKKDVPSGTVRELAHRLASKEQAPGVPQESLHGPVEARGATIGGSRVHSVRLPGFALSTEIVFGMPDQRLTIRHDAGPSAEPYVAGGLLAIRSVPRLVGLHRGLDSVMSLD